MRHHIISISVFVVLCGFITGCSDTTEPSDDGNGTVVMSTEFTSGGKVSRAFNPKTSPSLVPVDSLKVTYTAIVVSNLKLHQDSIDTDSTDDGTIKTGPFLLVFDSSGSHVAVSSSVPAGTYDRIKFEIHKLRNIDDSLEALLPDFVTNNATMKIMGYVWVGGAQLPFTYYSSNTENIQVRFAPSVAIAENSTVNVTLQFDPASVFSDGGVVLDPRDPTNENSIRGNIHESFVVMKK
jgi:hypothetical protein